MTLVIWQQDELIKIICILKTLLVVTVMLTTLRELFVIEDKKVLTEKLNQRSLPSVWLLPALIELPPRT